MTASEPREAEIVGALLGNYRVLAKLGEGGMGEVYVARHEALGSSVAIKVLQLELSRNADMVQRFFNEAQAATAIRNAGIVQVFDFGTTAGGRRYFVMELLEGQTLAARLKQRRLDYAECCRLGRQTANVLQAAHAAGIMHRDLKPDNLFLISDMEVVGGERVKVLDFGIAKLAGDEQATGLKTRTGLVLGTPHYMSPEQCRGASMVDARSDIYALGCILFEMVCGRPPFIEEGVGGLLGAHQYVEPPQPKSLAPDVPPRLGKLILQMLAKPPGERPQTMAAVGQALEEILQSLGGASKRASAPRRAPTAMVPPQLPPSSTTLGGSAGMRSVGGGPSKRRLPILLGGGAIVAVLAVLIAVAASNESGSGPAGGEAAIAASAADAEQAAPRPQGGPATTREIELECLRHQSSRSWSNLEVCADRLKPLNATLAKELQDRAVLETKALPEIVAFEAAMRDGNLKLARAALDKIPWQATRHPLLQKQYEQVEAEAIKELVARLEKAKDNDCKKYLQILQQEQESKPVRVTDQASNQVPCSPSLVAAADPEPADSKPAAPATPKPATPAAPKPAAPPSPKPAAPAAPKPAAPPSPKPACNAEELAEKGREHFQFSQHAMALVAYEQAYNCKAEQAYAEKAFIVACNIPNLGKAKLYWRRMPGAMRSRAIGVCIRNGITDDALNSQ